MGHHFGSIYVRHQSRLTRERVRAEVVKFFTAAGAARDDRGMPALAPLQLESGGSRLGIAVSPLCEGFIALIDSERYTACMPLAVHLSRALRTDVLWLQVCDAASTAALRWWQAGVEGRVPDHPGDDPDRMMAFLQGLGLPFLGACFDENDPKGWQARDFVVMGFKGVSAEAYFGADEAGDEDDEEEDEDEDDAHLVHLRPAVEQGWQLWQRLTAAPGGVDVGRLDDAFGQLAEQSGLYTIQSLDELQQGLLSLSDGARALALAAFMCKHGPVSAQADWRGRHADALMALGRFEAPLAAEVAFALFVRPDVLASYQRQAHWLAGCGRKDEAARLIAALKVLKPLFYMDESEPDFGFPPALAAQARALRLKRPAALEVLEAVWHEVQSRIRPEAHGLDTLQRYLAWTGRGPFPTLPKAPLALAVRAEVARRTTPPVRPERV